MTIESLPQGGTERGLPTHFDALVVLANYWEKGPPRPLPERWSPTLSFDSRLRARAAGELHRTGKFYKIIISGGRTAGPQFPSEAQALQDYLVKRYSDIPAESIVLEEESFDSVENVEKVIPLIQSSNCRNVAVLTSAYHLPKAEKIFFQQGVNVWGFSAEEILMARSMHHRRLLTRYTWSPRHILDASRSFALTQLLIIDQNGAIPRLFTRRMRFGG